MRKVFSRKQFRSTTYAPSRSRSNSKSILSRFGVSCAVTGYLGLFVLPLLAQAAPGAECGAYAQELRQNIGDAESLEALPAEQALEVMDLCAGAYSSCGFKICKNWMQQAAAELSPGEPLREEVSEVALIEEQEAPVPADKPKEGNVPLVVNPLAWLEQPMGCEELRDQIRARYAPLGSFSGLPQEKKDEVSAVLDFACTERFASCGFSNCPKADEAANQLAATTLDAGQGEEKPAQQFAEVVEPVIPTKDLEEVAVKKLLSMVAEHDARRQELRQEMLKRERASNLSWQRVAMRDELRERAKRPQRPKPSSSGVGYQTGNGNSQYPSYPGLYELPRSQGEEGKRVPAAQDDPFDAGFRIEDETSYSPSPGRSKRGRNTAREIADEPPPPVRAF